MKDAWPRIPSMPIQRTITLCTDIALCNGAKLFEVLAQPTSGVEHQYAPARAREGAQPAPCEHPLRRSHRALKKPSASSQARTNSCRPGSRQRKGRPFRRKQPGNWKRSARKSIVRACRLTGPFSIARKAKHTFSIVAPPPGLKSACGRHSRRWTNAWPGKSSFSLPCSLGCWACLESL